MDGNLQDARKDYAQGILTKEMLPSDPFELLTSWLHDAELNDPEEYNASVCQPSMRMGTLTLGWF